MKRYYQIGFKTFDAFYVAFQRIRDERSYNSIPTQITFLLAVLAFQSFLLSGASMRWIALFINNISKDWEN